MATYLTRKQFEALDPTAKKHQYPVRTRGVVKELRSRGLDIDYDRLTYLARSGVFKPVGGGVRGSAYLWSAEQVDAVAEYLARRNMYTPSAHACVCLNLSLDQFERELRDAGQKYLGTLTADPTNFKMIVHPAKGSGYARVEFLPAEDGE